MCDTSKKNNFEANKRMATETNKNYTSQLNTNNNEVNQTNISLCIEQFHKNISVGPEYVCTCCDQLWYKKVLLRNAIVPCTRRVLRKF